MPPQSADEPDVAVDEDEPELLSLPHAVSVKPVIAVADKVTTNALPNLFRSTYPTFFRVAVFAPVGAYASPGTYAPVVDGTLQEGERGVNRLVNATR